MSAFEEQVLAVYDLGALTLPVLDALASPWQYTDIDMGGYYGETAEDGKTMLQIVVETVEPGVVPDPEPGYEANGPNWYKAFDRISSERWHFM